jgi:DNA-binding CsgD family transcriptional regulator
MGIALRAVGLCAAADGELRHLRESVEVLAGTGAELEHARSLVELGAAIRRLGTRAQAREPLREGMELAHRCGAAPLVEQAREELLATGARPRRIVRTGIAALTPSELRVAHMAAEGLTNREIAQALFVTQRTVEGHLTHAFQKLDIASRGQLAERLAAEADSPR